MRFVELPERERYLSRSALSGRYLAGLCVAWAIAVKRKLRYPTLVGLWAGENLLHAGTKNEHERIYHDVRGFQEAKDFVDQWSSGDLRPTTEERLLLADTKITEEHIHQAEFDFELLYPDHCENKTEGRNRIRIRRFVEELERLSAKHGVYLRSDMPRGQTIVLYKAYGDETGYRVSFGPTGSMFLDRDLHGDRKM